MNPIGKWLHSRGPRLGVTVIAVLALGSAGGVAVAAERDAVQSAATSTSDTTTSTSDPTTSTSDPTTSTSDPTTSTDATTTTSDDLDSGESEKSSESSTGQTTTTSDELNALTVEPRVATNTTTVTGDPDAPRAHDCDEIWASTNNWDLNTVYVLLLGTVTIVVTPESNTTGNWSADAPFTGQIKVKAGQADEWVTIPPPGTTGTIVSPNGQDISHVEFCGQPGTTTQTTTAQTTTTATRGTSGGGGGGGGGVGGTQKAGGGGDAAATQAVGAQGGLPFTGLHVPLMIAVALGMGAAGLALRKRVNGSGSLRG